MRSGWLRVALAVSFAALAACTSSTGTTGGPTQSASPGSPTGTPTVRALLASGQPLPGGCADRHSEPTQTVAFVADGRAWAL
ncbi:MAG TPA: hypothetical protein VEN95_03065, partial [Actinomycetota bacterium]|nr:hypothetical protein [Actinomycetota bacterium]